MTEPVLGLLLILAPFVLGFDDDTARTLSIVLGVVILLSGLTTRWRLSLVKLIPLRVHFMTDVLLGIVAILAPFVLGFSDETTALLWFLIVGVGELAAAFGTAWGTSDDVAGARRTAPGV
jgi:SPW repeat-containing protein